MPCWWSNTCQSMKRLRKKRCKDQKCISQLRQERLERKYGANSARNHCIQERQTCIARQASRRYSAPSVAWCNPPACEEPCQPSPCRPPPCRPSPCRPPSCQPPPCQPPSCQPSPCHPPPCHPPPCHPPPCQPPSCQPPTCRPPSRRPSPCRPRPCRTAPPAACPTKLPCAANPSVHTVRSINRCSSRSACCCGRGKRDCERARRLKRLKRRHKSLSEIAAQKVFMKECTCTPRIHNRRSRRGWYRRQETRNMCLRCIVCWLSLGAILIFAGYWIPIFAAVIPPP